MEMKFFDKHLFRITDMTSALKAMKVGTVGGLIFTAMYILGFVIDLLIQVDPTTGTPLAKDELVYTAIGMMVAIALLLFLTWRIYHGKGCICSILLFVWFVIEMSIKIINGTAHPGWMVAYFFIALMMIQGIRGSWAYRQFSKQLPTTA